MTLHIASGHIGSDACQPSLEALWVAQLVQLGKGQQKSIMSQFLRHLTIAYDVLAHLRHASVIRPIQAPQSSLVALSPSLYE